MIYSIPGIGEGEGVGATITNLLGDESTLSVLQIRGDYEIDAITATDIPLFTPNFTIDGAYANGRKGGFSFYDRGPDSEEEPEFTLKFKNTWAYAVQANLYGFDKRIRIFSGLAVAIPEINEEESSFDQNVGDLTGVPAADQIDAIAAYTKNVLKYFDIVNLVVSRYGVHLDFTDHLIGAC